MKQSILRGANLSFGGGNIVVQPFAVVCDGKNIEIFSDDKALEQSVVDMLARSSDFKKFKKNMDFDACDYIGRSFPHMFFEVDDYSLDGAHEVRKFFSEEQE